MTRPDFSRDQPGPAEVLADCGGRLARNVLGYDDERTDALCDMLAGDQTEWDHQEWCALLSEILGSSLTVDECSTLYGQ